VSQTFEAQIQNPPGHDIPLALLEDFERGLDLLNPPASRVPCQVLGYGEISTVFAIQVDGVRDLAFKRVSCFEIGAEVAPYLRTYLEYNRLLETQVGLRLPFYGYAALKNERGRPIVYIIQQRLEPDSIGNHVLWQLSSQEITALFCQVLCELHKVWGFNRQGGQFQVGIDGQLSNWAIAGFDAQHPDWNPAAGLVYVDTSTPLMRVGGVEQLDAELFLRSAPPYLAWILRLLYLQDVMTRYYDPRKVIIDLIANFYKEQVTEIVPDLIAAANAYIQGDGAELRLTPIIAKEVSDYYREDALIWRLYLGMRRFDRFMRKKVFHREYPYILPGRIKR
jgi:hypothetical protein